MTDDRLSSVRRLPASSRTAPRLLASALMATILVAGLVAVPVLAQSQGTDLATDTATPSLSFIDAIILGVVEGVTEYLPVSSTGHLLVAQHLLGITGDGKPSAAADSYAIAIQFGAILAVVFLYWRRLMTILRGLVGRDRDGLRMAVALVAAFVPAAAIGLLGETYIKDHLFALWPIAAAWLVGGVVVLLVARHDAATRLAPEDGAEIEDLTVGKALVIGVLQCVAMWPGVSRSLVTILGGRLVGLSTIAAVEFSFLLGLITLTAATVYEALSEGDAIVATFGVATPLIGVAVAFVSAAVAVKWMVGYLHRHTLAVFGWYRLAVGAAVAALLFLNLI